MKAHITTPSRRTAVHLAAGGVVDVVRPACGAGGLAAFRGQTAYHETAEPITCGTCLRLIERARDKIAAEARIAGRREPPTEQPPTTR